MFVLSARVSAEKSDHDEFARLRLDLDPDFEAEREALKEYGTNAHVLDQDARFVFVFGVSTSNEKDLRKTAQARAAIQKRKLRDSFRKGL